MILQSSVNQVPFCTISMRGATPISRGCYGKSWRTAKSGLRCFDAFLKLLDAWQDLIANYFINRQSSGFVEGLNNKLKVLKRRCYGLRNVVRLFQRLTLDVEGYRRFSPWRQLAPISSAVSGNS
jgi:transposase